MRNKAKNVANLKATAGRKQQRSSVLALWLALPGVWWGSISESRTTLRTSLPLLCFSALQGLPEAAHTHKCFTPKASILVAQINMCSTYQEPRFAYQIQEFSRPLTSLAKQRACQCSPGIGRALSFRRKSPRK